MSTVLEIQDAISKLSPQDYAELMAALIDFSDDDWDREMKGDSNLGRLDFLEQEVARASKGARLLPIDSILREGE
ncbi:MAG: hypothetical protein ACKOB0_12125 [Chthoniobacterales bacterium]